MLDAPISSNAEIFLWGVCIIIGLVHALVFVDIKKRSDQKEEN